MLEEEGAGHVRGALGRAVQVDPGRPEGVHDDPDESGGRGDRHAEGDPSVAGVGVRGAAYGGPGEHESEEEEDDDGADVDQHLHPGDELGREQEVLDGETTECHDEPEGRVHELLGRDGDDRRAEGGDADQEEGDLDPGRREEAGMSGGRCEVHAWPPRSEPGPGRPSLPRSSSARRPSAA